MYRYILLTSFILFFFLSKENNFSMFINLTLWTILWFHEILSYGFFLWHFIHSKKIEFFSQLNFHRSASFYSKLTLASWATLEFDLFENWFADSSTSFLHFIPLQPWVLDLTRAGKGGFSMTRSLLRTETKWNSSRFGKCYFDDSFVLLSLCNLCIINFLSINLISQFLFITILYDPENYSIWIIIL